MTLGFISRVARRIPTLQACLTEPLCIPHALARLDGLADELEYAMESKRADIEYLLSCWWGVMVGLSDHSWGVQCILQCDIASFSRRLK